MTKPLAYADALALLGAEVNAAGGADVLVQELAEGVVLLYVTATAQEVVTRSWADLHTLAATHAVWPGAPGGSLEAPLPPVQADLRAVGRYLDAQQASDILVQEWGGGYHVGYVPRVDDAAQGGEAPRLLITLTDAELHPR
jgi:hypothetical protein